MRDGSPGSAAGRGAGEGPAGAAPASPAAGSVKVNVVPRPAPALSARYGLGVLDRGKLNFELGVDAQPRESPMHGEASNGFLGRAALGW